MARKSQSPSNKAAPRTRNGKKPGRRPKVKIEELTEKEIQHLVHELKVHQIELEMQNDELRRAQVELEESRAKYSDLYDFAPVGYFTFDRKGLILEVNLTGAGLLGVERERLIRKPFNQYIGKDCRDLFYLHCSSVFNTGERQTCEIRITRKGGGEFYAQLESVPFEDIKGKHVCRSWLSDVSVRRKKEEEASKLLEELTSVFNKVPIGIVYLDSNFRIISSNRFFNEFTGMQEKDLKGKLCYGIVGEYSDDPSRRGLEKICSFCKKEECFKYKRPTVIERPLSDKYIRVTTIPEVDEKGEIYRFMEIVEDITRDKLAMAEIESLSRFPSENPNPVLRISSEKKILYKNEAFNMLLKEKRLSEKDAFMILPENIDTLIDESIKKKKRHNLMEVTVGNKIISYNLIPVTKHKYVNLYGRDITARKKAEESLYRIEWLLKKSLTKTGKREQPYGDLAEINTSHVLQDALTEAMLSDIVSDYLDLLETSAAVYEKNGDYAMGIFSSGWCRFLDNASRNLCGTGDNRKALASGKWHCHESCWTDASMVSIQSGRPVDIECRGGIRLYAVPIRAGEEVVGSINFGYGDPPGDREKLLEIAERYCVSVDELARYAGAYETRPPFIIEIAKRRLMTSAELIGAIVEQKRAEDALQKAKDELEKRVEDRTAELLSAVDHLQKENAERKKAEEKLDNERQKLFALLEELPAFVYLQAPDHTVRFANRYFREQFGNPDGRLCHDILWGRKQPCGICPTFRVFETGEPQTWEWSETPDERVYEITDYPFTDIDGTPLVLELGFNITERKKTEERLKRSIEEKEVLLKEIHHRVKNNMTVISSLLRLQADKVKVGQYKEMFSDSVRRIKTMALIHENLYRAEDWAKINFGEYIGDMINSMYVSYGEGTRRIKLKKDIERVTLGVDAAIPCGLIVNELLSNALKYAFPEGRSGEISISLRTDDNNEVELSVCDNGIGMPDDLDFKKTDTLGLHLVDALVSQLHGEIELDRKQGTGFHIRFRRH